MWMIGVIVFIQALKFSSSSPNVININPCGEVHDEFSLSDSLSVSVSVNCHFVQEPIKEWTIIHRRFNGSLSFDRTWNEYRNGFGDLQGEHWLGLETVHQMTVFDPHELMVVLKTYDGTDLWATYEDFSIGSEADQYRIKLGSYSDGNAGDHLAKHNGMAFSTPDRDNDVWSGNCAEIFHSGWWFSECHTANLNGLYQNDTQYDKMIWGGTSLTEAQMMIRLKRLSTE